MGRCLLCGKEAELNENNVCKDCQKYVNSEDNETIKCKKCGMINSASNEMCSRCGFAFDQQDNLDDNGLVDKGFEPVYWNLSYRRKLIRTVWMIPIAILLIVLINIPCIHFSHGNPIIESAVIVIVLIAQFIYTYQKYKKDNKNAKK